MFYSFPVPSRYLVYGTNHQEFVGGYQTAYLTARLEGMNVFRLVIVRGQEFYNWIENVVQTENKKKIVISTIVKHKICLITIK